MTDLGTKRSVTAGLLSDTHLPYRMAELPEGVLDAMDGVDVILHAGDVDRPATLDALREIAPVYAVRGNLHVFDLSRGGASLPHRIDLVLAGRRILLTHGYLPGLASFWFKGRDLALHLLGTNDRSRCDEWIARRLANLYTGADVIIFGHTHHAHVEWIDDTLLVNPGAVCPTPGEQQTLARLWLGQGAPRVEILKLEALARR
jgi:putative phosphoesterase